MEIEVIHDINGQRFYCVVDGQECELEYDKPAAAVLNFYHTYVPEQYRNQGIAALLLKEAAQFARQNGYKIRPSCSYAELYFKRYKEYTDLVLKE